MFLKRKKITIIILLFISLLQPLTLIKAAKIIPGTPLPIGKEDGDRSVSAVLDEQKGLVKIYGNGLMKNNENEASLRWFSGYEDSIKTIIIEEGVTSIGDFAFGGNGQIYTEKKLSNLTNVKISNTVENIGRGAFYGAKSLSYIDIPGSVKEIGAHAFNFALNLSEVTLHEGLKRINEGAFMNCPNLKSIIIPKGISTINENVFDVNLRNITLPKTLKEIKSGAFKGQINVTIYSKNTTIEHDAFPPNSIISCYKGSLTEQSARDKGNLIINHIKEKNSVIKSPKPSVQVKRKKLIIKCAAVSNAVGYQIRYSKNKSMKDAKVVNKRSYISKKMKPGTVYYVQARAYDTIIRDKIQGKWSKAVKVVIK